MKLKAVSWNIKIPSKLIYVIDKNNVIQQISTNQIKEGDKNIFCPFCDTLHLFGFNQK